MILCIFKPYVITLSNLNLICKYNHSVKEKNKFLNIYKKVVDI